ncbi:hypothetical protein [Nonomuraea sp. NPDC050643]|uniref:hypothetical protein n=1 Tax=Nonomuraea sp. NPDC050643 TaxID=3155660 RepID=UPI0033EA98F8
MDTQPVAVAAPAPRAVRTVYVLRRHRRQLVVGVLLDHTTHPLANRQARAWATRQAAAGATSLLPWRLIDEADPESGWHTTSGLLVEQYVLYRHPGGWHLLGAVTRASRPRTITDADAQAWASDVLTPLPALDWEHGPVIPGATLWYATP